MRSVVACMVAVVVVVAVVVSGSEVNSSLSYRRYSDRYLYGDVKVSLKGVTLVQCAAACGPSGVFNAKGSWPNYSCFCLNFFSTLVKSSLYSVYYDGGLYQGLGFYRALGKLLFMPPLDSPKVTWLDAYFACKDMWAAFLVPQTQAQWEWMKEVAANRSHEGMWIGLQEQKEDSDSYVWMGMTTILFPGALNMTVPNDDLYYYLQNATGKYVTDDPRDCGALVPGGGAPRVVIHDCYTALHADYICEALAPPL